MRRINPKTKEPFKHGEIREDGYVFVSYNTSKKRKDGTFKENWYTPEKFENRNNYIIGIHAKNRKTVVGRAVQLLNGAKGRASRGNGIVSIDKNWVLEKLEKGVCELTNLPFDLELSDTRMNPYSPSLDRIDANNPDYTKENTRLVLTAVNLALSNFGQKTMQPILEAMLQGIKNK